MEQKPTAARKPTDRDSWRRLVCQEDWQRYGTKTACDFKSSESGITPKPASVLGCRSVTSKSTGHMCQFVSNCYWKPFRNSEIRAAVARRAGRSFDNRQQTDPVLRFNVNSIGERECRHEAS